MRPKSSILTPRELEIMKVVWAKRAATVREVYEVFSEKPRAAYTTVMTLMSILEKKGYLTRHRKNRSFLYEPRRSESSVIGEIVQDLVTRVFDGSVARLMVYLLEDRHLSEEELEGLVERIRNASL